MLNFNRAFWKTRYVEIAVGTAQAHVHEVGNNEGYEIDKYHQVCDGGPEDRYCMQAETFWALKAYADTFHISYTPQSIVAVLKVWKPQFARDCFLPSGSCGEVMRDAQRRGIWVPAGHAHAMGLTAPCLVMFDWNGDGKPDHVELLIAFGSSSCDTVGANTTSGDGGNQSDGQGVYQRTRPYTHVLGYVKF